MSVIVFGNVTLPSAQAGIELVENGRFETGDLSGWTTSIPAAPNVTISSLAYSGSWCARLEGDGAIGQDLIHPPTSELTFRARCETSGATSSIYVIFWVISGSQVYYIQTDYPITDSWTRLSVMTPTDANRFHLSCSPVGDQPPPTPGDPPLNPVYSEPKLIDDVSLTFESDEYFYDVGYVVHDDSGDGYADSVEITMDVDTTYSGALYIYVDASLADQNGMELDANQSTWYVTSDQVEYGFVTLHLLPGNPSGLYDVYLSLYEDARRLILEDTYVIDDVVYLYPPDYSPPPLQHQLILQTQGSGTTTPAPGSHSYSEGTTIPVEAHPDSGWVFDHWLLDSVDIGDVNPYTVTIDSDHTMTAVFVEALPTQHSLSIVVEGSGTTNPTQGSTLHADGSTVQVDALPDEGWMLDYWVLDDVNIGDTNPTSVTMDSDHTITAVFTEIVTIMQELRIEVQGEGTTDPIPELHVYPLDTMVSVLATPDTGWVFDHWLLDGVNAGSMNPFDVTMDAAHTLAGVFVATTGSDLPLEIEVNGSGTTQPAPGMHSYPRDSDVVVTAIPDSGWKLNYWLLDSVQVGSQANITVTMNSDHAVVAVFTLIDDIADDQPPIAEAGNDQTVAENTDVTFDATASSDNIGIVEYHWDFGDGNTDTGATCTHQYTTAGHYTVILTVIDAAEHSDIDTLQVTVTNDEAIDGFEWWMLILAISLVFGIVIIALRRRPR